MPETLPGQNEPTHPMPDEKAHELFHDFRAVDMQFNIGRIEGFPARGLDIITPERKRFYLCEGSDQEAEELIKQNLGGASVLKRLATERNIGVYEVPNGSRTMAKSFKQSVYTDEYMRRQAYRTGRFVGRLRNLDPGMFGLAVQDIALTYGLPDRENTDDVNLTVIPPLKPLGKQPEVSDDELADQSDWFFSTNQLAQFMKGVRNE